jgi:hypothetical protein
MKRDGPLLKPGLEPSPPSSPDARRGSGDGDELPERLEPTFHQVRSSFSSPLYAICEHCIESQISSEGPPEKQRLPPWQVPFETVLRHTEAAAAVVDRIVSYVDERIKVETRYWNERKRLKLDLLASGSEDRLDDVMQALMLFQDVQSTQGAVMVEEMEKVGTSGCMRLTPES